LTITSRSEADTAAAARDLAGDLRPDDVVLLTGDLGAGKTAFVRGLAEGLGLDSGEVSSPTFTLIHEYRGGRLTLYHIDLYRLSPREADDLGLDDLIVSGGVVAIEWPDRWLRPPTDAIRVELKAHATIEEEIFYPAFKAKGDRADDDKMYFEALEEHRAAGDLVLPDLLNTPVDSEKFSGRAKVLKELVKHHADEEEKEMFPRSKKLLSKDELAALGTRMAARKTELVKQLKSGMA